MAVPDKSLGQHWLDDTATLESIIDFADVNSNDVVLEIGPGQGALTRKLVQKAAQLIAIEFDEDLARKLEGQFPGRNVEVKHADILSFNLSDLPKKYKVVANLPYYITSKIVRLLLEASNPPISATLLVQKEVAERLAAKPGEMSVLSVSAQFYSDVELGIIVPPELFTPPPKVDSQVVKLTYRGPKFSDVQPKDFFKVIKTGFSERRKKLRSSLSGGLQIPKNEADVLLKLAGISDEARAQELSLEQWRTLTKSYLATIKQ